MMEYKDLHTFTQSPHEGGFEAISRRLRRRRAWRWSAAVMVVAAGVAVGVIGFGKASEQPSGEVLVASAVIEEAQFAQSTPPRNLPSAQKSAPTPTATQQPQPSAQPETEMTTPSATTEAPLPYLIECNEAAAQSESRPLPESTVAAPQMASVADLIVEETAAEPTPLPEATAHEPKSPSARENSNLLIAPNILIPTAEKEENRLFGIVATSPIDHFHLGIYNRRGQLVYSTDDPSAHWDATYQGSLVPQGTYVWMATFRDADGIPRREKGTITVVR